MITVVSWKWARPNHGHRLAHVCDYTAEHVNVWSRMVRRNLTIPHRIVCVTDDPVGITECDTYPCPPIALGGGCYHRLWEYSPGFSRCAGKRFLRMDLDCVITGNIDHIAGRAEPFVINRYIYPDKEGQYYNGALVLMDTGARAQVWNDFHPIRTPQRVKANRYTVGSDQAWTAIKLGPGEATFGPEHGIYEAKKIGKRLPGNASIVFFSGARDPSERRWPWVMEHWV